MFKDRHSNIVTLNDRVGRCRDDEFWFTEILKGTVCLAQLLFPECACNENGAIFDTVLKCDTDILCFNGCRYDDKHRPAVCECFADK